MTPYDIQSLAWSIASMLITIAIMMIQMASISSIHLYLNRFNSFQDMLSFRIITPAMRVSRQLVCYKSQVALSSFRLP